VLQLRSGGHLLVLLEHGLLHHRVSAGALAQGAQEDVQKKTITGFQNMTKVSWTS